MKQNLKLKKTQRLDIRIAPEIKKKLIADAEANNLTQSAYLTELIINPAEKKNAKKINTHEAHINSCLPVNQIMNILSEYPSISDKVKHQIESELKPYVIN